jgi:NADP-dependent aldehyde dehydrogenase
VLQQFIHDLGRAIQKTVPAPMLHPGIVRAYKEKKGAALLQEDVHLVAESEAAVGPDQGLPTIATTTGSTFLKNPLLHQEIFGPYSLVVRCKDLNEMTQIARELEGQLTATMMAEESEVATNNALVAAVQDICGRFILNGVPTGVEVCLSMHHGGPFPSCTDSRFSSVGADGIKRFARPQAYQNWSDALLPNALKNQNPLGIWRRVNNVLTKDAVG